MPQSSSASGGGDGCEDLERTVQATEDLVHRTVLLLCRGRLPETPGAAARDALAGITPRVRGALGALEGIEGLRPLTDEEVARRHAFKMLLREG